MRIGRRQMCFFPGCRSFRGLSVWADNTNTETALLAVSLARSDSCRFSDITSLLQAPNALLASVSDSR